MSLQQYYEAFRSGYWADEDPKKCECGGSGWALSDVDTWHACPIHYDGSQPHPEDWEAQEAQMNSKPYRGDNGKLYITVGSLGDERTTYRLFEPTCTHCGQQAPVDGYAECRSCLDKLQHDPVSGELVRQFDDEVPF